MMVPTSRRGFLASAAAAAVLAPSATGQAIKLTDWRGKELKLKASAKRLVVLPIPMASMVMCLDLGPERVVGMHPSAMQSIRDGFLDKIYPEASKIRSDITRGNEFVPNIEAVMALRPDAVLQWSEPQAAIRALDDARLNAVGLHGSPHDQTIHERNLEIVGTLIGRGDRAARIIATQRSTIADVQKLTKRRKPVRVLYLSRAKGSIVPGRGESYQDFWIRTGGGVNVAADYRVNGPINSEQLVAWNPEVIFLGAFDAATPAEIYKQPIFSSVAAVRQKRVYKLPHGGYRWDPASQESHLTHMWTSSLIHPATVRFDLRKEMRAAYAFLYNYTLSDGDIDAILAISENGGSAYYDRFARA